MVVGGYEACPACDSPVGGEAWCGACGLELAGDEARALRAVATDLAAAEAELNAVWARRDALANELAGRRWARAMNATPSAATRPHAPDHRPLPPGAEWNVERVRNLLLWTGAVLLAFAALAFTAVAWAHLGPAARAELLVAITIVSAVGATATRSRLPATSGALTGLAIALALIDWQIARRAGAAPGLSGPAWWAIGTAVVAAASIGLGRVAAPAPAHRAATVLAPTAAVLTLVSSTRAPWSVALGLAVLAAALVAVDRVTSERVIDPVVRALLRAESRVAWPAGVVLAIIAAFGNRTAVAALTPAAVMLAFALAPGIALARSAAATSRRVTMASLVIASVVGAALTSASTSVGPIGLLTLAVVLGSAVVATAPSLGEVWRHAARVVGVLAAVPGAVFAARAAGIAEFGPNAWLAHAWTGTMGAKAVRVVAGPHTPAMRDLGWCAAGILASSAIAIWLTCRAPRRAPAPPPGGDWRVLAAGVALVTIVLLPIASGASALVACIVATSELVAAVIGAAFAARREPSRALPYGVLALLPAAPALGWATMTTTASITVLVSVACAALIATAVGRERSLRAAHAALGGGTAATLGAVIALAAGASLQCAGFTAGTVAGVLLVLGSQARRDTTDGIALEVVGGIGLLGGAALASRSEAWVAGTFTAAVPMLLAARLRAHRSVLYAALSAAAALTATWAWLAAAGVPVVEAYTLPAAVVAIVAGRLAYRDGPARSWLHYGPALALLLGPTLVLALARNDDTRAIAIGLAALAILLAGARQRLQAPIVLGALTLVILGLDKLGPTAVRLPRWIMLAFAGSLLLWVGSTFERRRDTALRAARRFERLG